MSEDFAILSQAERDTVLHEIRRTCEYREWELHAAHVQSTQSHTIVTAARSPERAMGEPKAYASRALNPQFGHRRRRWARHASTGYLWDLHRLTAH